VYINLFALNYAHSPTLIDISNLKRAFIVRYCYCYGQMQCDDCRSNRNKKNHHNMNSRIFG
jgi:hypothetical protein